MTLDFEVLARVSVEYNKNGQPTSQGIDSGFILLLPEQIDETPFKGGELLTKHGHEMVTDILVKAIIGNVHAAHQSNLIDSAEHFRKIIKLMEDLFVVTPEINFENNFKKP